MNNNKPNNLDFIKALEVLQPYKSRLLEIHKAYLNDEFEPEVRKDDDGPYAQLVYFFDSKAYETYHVKELGIELNEIVQKLDSKSYRITMYFNIEEKHGMDLPYTFNSSWTLEEVYYYLIHLFDLEDNIIIENSLLNGDILGILNCLFIRL